MHLVAELLGVLGDLAGEIARALQLLLTPPELGPGHAETRLPFLEGLIGFAEPRRRLVLSCLGLRVILGAEARRGLRLLGLRRRFFRATRFSPIRGIRHGLL